MENSMVIAADNIEALEEMLKYWKKKGYEIASERYCDKTSVIKLIFWQKLQKK